MRVASHVRVVQVHHKLDTFGIGAQHTNDPNGIAWKQNRDFENLLKRLNATSEHPTGDEAGPAPIDGFQPARADDLATDVIAADGRDEERKERKLKKKKRHRGDSEASEPAEKPSKKQKRAESTTPNTESVEACSSSSNIPTREATMFVVIYCSVTSGP